MEILVHKVFPFLPLIILLDRLIEIMKSSAQGAATSSSSYSIQTCHSNVHVHQLCRTRQSPTAFHPLIILTLKRLAILIQLKTVSLLLHSVF